MIILTIEGEGSAALRMELAPGEYSLGSDPASAIVVGHPTVSGHHCDLFVQADGEVIVLDAGSTNGTWVAGEQTGRASLSPGQSFQVGSVMVALKSASSMPVPRRIPNTQPRPAIAGALPKQPPTMATAPSLAGSFPEELPDAFAYPFRGEAYLYIVVAVVLGYAPMLLPIIPGVLGWGIGIVVGCYLFLLWQQIIQTTIDGRDRFPDFPHVSLDWQENFSLYLRYIGLTWVCFSPVFFCNMAKMWNIDAPFWLVCCCFGLSCLYFPMALLAFLVTDSFAVLNPFFIGRSMVKKLADYLLLAGFLALMLGGGYVVFPLFKSPPDAGGSFGHRAMVVTIGAISEAVGLYLAFVWLRLLGLFYRHHKDRLDWY